MKKPHTSSSTTRSANICCFFCLIKEADPSVKRQGIANYFKYLIDNSYQEEEQHVLVVSGLWNIAMSQPDDSDFPSLGIFEYMTSLMQRGLRERDWLLRGQNICIPYYAAHIIGSYTMNKAESAEKAVTSGVIPPLLGLFRGKMTWVEQRVAARALGHLASHQSTFQALVPHEEELVELAIRVASTSLDVVYSTFIGVEEEDGIGRLKYHKDLLTRGIGGLEIENQKAEEWASQLQCWSLSILSSFAIKENPLFLSLSLMCNQHFLANLCEMWGGLVSNSSSPGGIGLIRILCYNKTGRESVAESRHVIDRLCNLSRSSDDWQYMGIDCLLLLLKDPGTRYKVIERAVLCLVDLVQLKTLAGRSKLGAVITRAMFGDSRNGNSRIKDNRVKTALEEVWDLMVERRKKEKELFSDDDKVEERRVLVSHIKQEGNNSFWLGETENAILKYTEGLSLCPLRLRKDRIVLYSNRAQCYLVLGDPDAAISDTTRALCLSSPVNSHSNSLWRRAQAYDMKGLGKESLIDCLMFIKSDCFRSKTRKNAKVLHFAARMIRKQMDSTRIFAAARSKTPRVEVDDQQKQHRNQHDETLRIITGSKTFPAGLTTIVEEASIAKGVGKKDGGRERIEKS